MSSKIRTRIKELRPILIFGLVVVAWSSATVASKHLYLAHLATPFTLVACRFTLASFTALTIFGINHRRRATPIPFVGGWKTYLLGGSFMIANMIGFNTAILYISATIGGLVFFGINPVLMLVISYFWLGTRFSRRQMVGVAIALSGMLIVISGGDLGKLASSFETGNLPLGLGLMLIGALGWAFYGLWGKRYGSLYPGAGLLSTGINQLIAVIPVWGLLWWLEPQGLAALNLEAWLFILYVGIVPSGIGFAVYYTLLKELRVEQAATIQMLSPVFTTALAIFFLGEPFSLALLVGTIILLGGIRICTYLGSAQPIAAEPIEALSVSPSLEKSESIPK